MLNAKIGEKQERMNLPPPPPGCPPSNEQNKNRANFNQLFGLGGGRGGGPSTRGAALFGSAPHPPPTMAMNCMPPPPMACMPPQSNMMMPPQNYMMDLQSRITMRHKAAVPNFMD